MSLLMGLLFFGSMGGVGWGVSLLFRRASLRELMALVAFWAMLGLVYRILSYLGNHFSG
jgi:hypothetical protein